MKPQRADKFPLTVQDCLTTSAERIVASRAEIGKLRISLYGQISCIESSSAAIAATQALLTELDGRFPRIGWSTLEGGY